jgi:hypothetical protein
MKKVRLFSSIAAIGAVVAIAFGSSSVANAQVHVADSSADVTVTETVPGPTVYETVTAPTPTVYETQLLAPQTVTVTETATATVSPSAPTPVHLVAVGDIACGPGYQSVTPTTCQQAATEQLAASLNPKYVLAAGDLVYNSGTYTNFVKGYNPTWGLLKSITKPVPGNHEGGSGQAGYFQYFGAQATPLDPTCVSACMGSYSFNTGSWHIAAVNTASCGEDGSTCSVAAQTAWLKADLQANTFKCKLVFLHHPLWSNGVAATATLKPLYQIMQDNGVDLVIAGHQHSYERFAPQNVSDGKASPTGLTEIIAGTGGVNLQPVGSTPPANRVAAFSQFGVLDLVLSQGGWESSFHGIDKSVKDPATGSCN